MAVRTWRVIARSANLVATSTEGATLLIEAPRPAHGDPQLAEAIERLAPHLAFGSLEMRDRIAERVAISGDERIVVGRVIRGAMSVTYLLSSHIPIEVDDVVAAYLGEVRSPFDYLGD